MGLARKMTAEHSIDIDSSLAPILGTVLDSVVVMSTDGLVIGWNAIAAKTFGWSADEALNQYLGDLIVPEQHRKAHREGLMRMASGGKPHVLNRLIEITALHRDGHEMPIELSITTALSGSSSVFVGFIRDISERREAEALIARQALKNRLMFDIANMASDSDSFEDALRKALEAICEITGWPVGHAFVVPPGNPNTLCSSGIWFETEQGLADKLRAATDAIVFGPGVGLPGEILLSGEPKWIADTNAESNFPRKGNGFLGAFGFPLKRDGGIIAILEFFSESEAAPEPDILLIVRALGEQVGRVFERKRTQDHQELLLHELDHRVKNILGVVQAVAQQTFRRAESIDEASTIFRGRLIAIAQAQDILVSQNLKGAMFLEIIEGALRGSGVSPDRVVAKGPEVNISARNAVTISLAIHELCTNAFKYGAFSTDEGSVSINWKLENNDGKKEFHFEWREKGGPPVTSPQRKGFGSSLLERGLGAQLGGTISLEYPVGGLICKYNAPLPSSN